MDDELWDFIKAILAIFLILCIGYSAGQVAGVDRGERNAYRSILEQNKLLSETEAEDVRE